MAAESDSPALGLKHHRTALGRATAAYRQHQAGTPEEGLILDNLPLVWHIVRKFSPHVSRTVDEDDLVSVGTIGLVKAARTYDPAKHAEFRTYAYILIRGAIVDELRKNTFVPTGVIHQVRAIEAAYHRFTGVHGRPPDDEELAAELGVALEQLYRSLKEARRQHFLSIHGLSEEGPVLAPLVPADDSPSPLAEASRREMAEKLAVAIAELSARDRQIVLLYYEQELTMKEIAAVLEITESRVSQLHASAVFKLAMRLRSQP
ncbi:MAG: FliA/WhiG family RNA polymerase sigma factor [Planctomycetota bacterium]|nr:FliA/WhiG family RNA polymerase sigma factor [Planctomycetota bacterium]